MNGLFNKFKKLNISRRDARFIKAIRFLSLVCVLGTITMIGMDTLKDNSFDIFAEVTPFTSDTYNGTKSGTMSYSLDVNGTLTITCNNYAFTGKCDHDPSLAYVMWPFLDGYDYSGVQSNTKKIVFAPGSTCGDIDFYLAFHDMTSLEEVDMSNLTINSTRPVMISSMFANDINLTKVTLPENPFEIIATAEYGNSMFEGCSSLVTIENLSSLSCPDDERVSFDGMFSGCSSLTSINGFTSFDVLSFSNTFKNCTALESIDLSFVNTSYTVYFSKDTSDNGCSIFTGCKNLQTIKFPASGIKLQYAHRLFYGLKSLTTIENLDKISFDSSVYTLAYMFYGCSKLETLDLTSFNTSGIENMDSMFQGCTSLKSVDISTFDFTRINHLAYMFGTCSELTTIKWPTGPINVSNSMCYASNMFKDCNKLESISFSNWNIRLKDASAMFSQCYNLKEINFGENFSLNGQNSYSMREMFYKCYSLTKVDLSKIHNISTYGFYANGIFKGCRNLRTVTLPEDPTFFSKMNDISEMFAGCTTLSKIYNLDKMDTSNVEAFQNIFIGCKTLIDEGEDTNGKYNTFSNFDMSKAVNLMGMFSGCKKITTIDARNWNTTSNLVDLSSVFDYCENLKDVLGLEDFVITNVSSTANMFRNCKELTTETANKVSEWVFPDFEDNKLAAICGMFKNCIKITNLNLSNFEMNGVREFVYGDPRNAIQPYIDENKSGQNVAFNRFARYFSDSTSNIYNYSDSSIIRILPKDLTGETLGSGSTYLGLEIYPRHASGLVQGCTSLKSLDISGLDFNDCHTVYSGNDNNSLWDDDYSYYFYNESIDHYEYSNGDIVDLNNLRLDGEGKPELIAKVVRKSTMDDEQLSLFYNCPNLTSIVFNPNLTSLGVAYYASNFNTRQNFIKTKTFTKNFTLKYNPSSSSSSKVYKDDYYLNANLFGIPDENLPQGESYVPLSISFNGTPSAQAKSLLIGASADDLVQLKANGYDYYYTDSAEYPGYNYEADNREAQIVAPIKEWDISDNQDGSLMAKLYSSGELIISGTGRISHNYINSTTTALTAGKNYRNPWRSDYYLDDSGNKVYYRKLIIKVTIKNKIVASDYYTTGDFSYLFADLENCEYIDANMIQVDETTSDIEYMFHNCYALKELDLSSWNTSGITTMKNMFRSCESLTELDVSNFDTSKNKDYTSMFDFCISLTKLDISNFDLSSATYMERMFASLTNMTDLTLPSSCNFTKNVKMSNLFSADALLEEIDLSNWNFETSSIYGMFNNCKNLKEVSFGNVTLTGNNTLDMDAMFVNCMMLKEIDLSGFSNPSTSELYVYRAFSGCSNLRTVILPEDEHFFEHVTNYSKMFEFDISLSKIYNMDKMNTSSGKEFFETFFGCRSLLSEGTDANGTYNTFSVFDMTNAENLTGMFNNCKKLTTINADNWNTTDKLVDLTSVFDYCENLESVVGLEKFVLTNVTSTANMFRNCRSITDEVGEQVHEWVIPTLESGNNKLAAICGMFKDCVSLTKLNLSNFYFGEGGGNRPYVYSYLSSDYNKDELTNFNETFANARFFNTRAYLVNQIGTTSRQVKSGTLDPSTIAKSNPNNGYAGSAMYPRHASGLVQGCTNLTTLDISGMDFTDCNTIYVGSNNDEKKSIQDPLVTCATYYQYNKGVSGYKYEDGTDVDFDNLDNTKLITEAIMQPDNSNPGKDDENLTLCFDCPNLTKVVLNKDLKDFGVAFRYQGRGSHGYNFYDCTPLKGLTSRKDLQANQYATVSDSDYFLNGGLFGFSDENIPDGILPLEILFNGTPSLAAKELVKELDTTLVTSKTISKKNYYEANDYDVYPGYNYESDYREVLMSIASWDISEERDKSVIATLYDNGDMFITGEGYISSDAYLRSPWGNELEKKALIERVIVKDNVTAAGDLSYMFQGMSNLKYADISKINTNVPECKDLKWLFRDNEKLEEVVLPSDLVNSNTEDISLIFYTCKALTSLDVSGWDVSNVTNMSTAFQWCSNLTTLDVSDWDISSCEDMSYLFSACMKLNNLNLSSWNTSNVINMAGVFGDCYNLNNVNTTGWDTSSVTNMNYMFYANPSVSLNVSGFDTSKVTSMEGMFSYSQNLKTLDLSGWNTENVTNMYRMFDHCCGLTSLDVSNFNVKKVTNMDSIFDSLENLETLDLSKWSCDALTSCYRALHWCIKLKEIDLSGFGDLARLTNCNITYTYDVPGGTLTGTTQDGMLGYSNSLTTIKLGEDLTGFGKANVTTKVTTPESSNTESNVPVSMTQFYANSATPLETTIFVPASKINDEEYLSVINGYNWAQDNRSITILAIIQEWDISELQDKSLMATLYSNGDLIITGTGVITGRARYKNGDDYINDTNPHNPWYDTEYAPLIKKVVVKDNCSVSTSTSDRGLYAWLADLENLEEVDLAKLKTTDIKLFAVLFKGNGKLNNVDLSAWDFSSAVSFELMFYQCESLSDLTLPNNMVNIKTTNIRGMFRECTELTSINTAGWNTSNVTNMRAAFFNCNISSLDVSGWNTGKVTDMSDMFNGCYNLSSLDVSNWNTSNVTNMSDLFVMCDKLSTLNVSGWNTGNVTNMSCMFYGCSNLSSLDVSGWNTGKVTDMTCMFYKCSNLSSLDVSGWNTGKVTDMPNMFCDCSNLSSLDVSGWDTGKVTYMPFMFYGCSNLNSLDVSGWNTGNVTSMAYMFCDCSNLNSLDVSGWDTGKVTKMLYMFYGCSNLSSLDVSNWNTSKVSEMFFMFYNCSALTNLDVSNFDFTSVNDVSGMFSGCSSLTALDLSKINFSDELITGYEYYEYDPDDNIIDDISYVANIANYCDSLTEITFGDNLTSFGQYEIDKYLEKTDTYSDEYYDTTSGLFYIDAPLPVRTNIIIPAGKESNTTYMNVIKNYNWLEDNRLISVYKGSVDDDNLVYKMLDFDPNSVKDENGNGISDWLEKFNVKTKNDTTRVISKLELKNKNVQQDIDMYSRGLYNNVIYDINLTTMEKLFFDSKIKSFNAHDLDTSTVTNMSGLFCTCEKLSSIDFGDNFDTSNVTEMNSMFVDCILITTLTLPEKFDTSKVTDMGTMFGQMTNLETINLPNAFSMENVLDAGAMFVLCQNLKNIDLSKLDFSKAYGIGSIYTMTGLDTIDLSTLSSESYNDEGNIYHYNPILKDLGIGDYSKASNIIFGKDFDIREVEMFTKTSDSYIQAGEKFANQFKTYALYEKLLAYSAIAENPSLAADPTFQALINAETPVQPTKITFKTYSGLNASDKAAYKSLMDYIVNKDGTGYDWSLDYRIIFNPSIKDYSEKTPNLGTNEVVVGSVNEPTVYVDFGDESIYESAPTYIWQKKNNDGSWTDLTASDSSTYNTSELKLVPSSSNKGYYRCKVTNGPLVYAPSDREVFFNVNVEHTLTVTSEDETKGTVNDISGNYVIGDEITAVATSLDNHGFKGWYNGDTLVSSNKSYTFTMPDSNLTLTAKFTDLTLVITGEYTFNTKQIKPSFKVYDGETEINASNYDVTYGENIHAGDNAGSLSVTFKNTSAYSGTITKTFDINKLDHSIGFKLNAISKVYDGNADYTLSEGIINAYDVIYSGTMPNIEILESLPVKFSYEFANKKAGVNKTVKVTYDCTYQNITRESDLNITDFYIHIGDDGPRNYFTTEFNNGTRTFSVPNAGSITPLELEYTYEGDKVYDGTSDANVAFTLTNVIEGDDVTLTNSTLTGDYYSGASITSEVGTGYDITLDSGMTFILSGDDKGNYSIPTITGLKGDITVLGIDQATIDNIQDVIYTGLPALPQFSISLNGTPLNSSDYEVSCSDIDVTNSAQATITGKGNYAGSSATFTFKILPKPITVDLSSDITNKEKVYDIANTYYFESGNTSSTKTITRDGVNGEVLNFTLSGTYNNELAGNSKIITITETFDSVTGGEAKTSNYNVTFTNETYSDGVISKKEVFYTATGVSKVYDGTIDAEVDVAFADPSGIYPSDSSDVSFVKTRLTGKFTSSAKSDTPVTITEIEEPELTGDKASNYFLSPVNDKSVSGTISNKLISNATDFNYTNSFVYTGLGIEPVVTITDGDDTLTIGTDYTVEYSDNIDATTSSTKAKITLTGKGNYSGTKELEFDITAKPITVDLSSDITNKEKVYDIADTYYFESGNTSSTKTITRDGVNGEKLNFTLSGTYNNELAGNSKTITITETFDSVTGGEAKTSNYNVTFTYDTYSDGVISKKEVFYTATGVSKVYDGNTDAEVDVAFANPSGIYPSDSSDVSFVKTRLTGKFTSSAKSDTPVTITDIEEPQLTGDRASNYFLSLISNKSVSAPIGNKSIASCTNYEYTSVFTYSGVAHEPVVTITDGDDTLTLGTDYTVEYSDNIDATTSSTKAKITLTGKGNYSGTKELEFTINKYQVEVNLASYLTNKEKVYDGNTYYYFESTSTDNSYHVTYDGVNGEKINDIIYASYDNENVGTDKTITASLGDDSNTVTGGRENISNYQLEFGSYSAHDGIITARDFSSCAVISNLEDSYTYEGKAIIPDITLTLDGDDLTKEIDYEVNVTNNVNFGLATLTITGINNYLGSSITKTFYITKKEVTIDVSSYAVNREKIFDGNNKYSFDNETFTESYSGQVNGCEEEMINFTLSGTYDDEKVRTNKNISMTYSFDSVTGGNASTDNYDVSFINYEYTNGEIKGKTTESVETSISGIDSWYYYTGLPITPSITLELEGVTLEEGEDKDYTVSYEDNTEVGPATVTITGCGNYVGTNVLHFEIRKAPLELSNVSLRRKSDNSLVTNINPLSKERDGDEKFKEEIELFFENENTHEIITFTYDEDNSYYTSSSVSPYGKEKLASTNDKNAYTNAENLINLIFTNINIVTNDHYTANFTNGEKLFSDSGFIYDSISPEITLNGVTCNSSYYGKGQTITVTLKMSEDVKTDIDASKVYLTLETMGGNEIGNAIFDSVTNGNEINFKYTIPLDSDSTINTEGIKVSLHRESGKNIYDIAGNELGVLGANLNNLEAEINVSGFSVSIIPEETDGTDSNKIHFDITLGVSGVNDLSAYNASSLINLLKIETKAHELDVSSYEEIDMTNTELYALTKVNGNKYKLELSSNLLCKPSDAIGRDIRVSIAKDALSDAESNYNIYMEGKLLTNRVLENTVRAFLADGITEAIRFEVNEINKIFKGDTITFTKDNVLGTAINYILGSDAAGTVVTKNTPNIPFTLTLNANELVKDIYESLSTYVSSIKTAFKFEIETITDVVNKINTETSISNLASYLTKEGTSTGTFDIIDESDDRVIVSISETEYNNYINHISERLINISSDPKEKDIIDSNVKEIIHDIINNKKKLDDFIASDITDIQDDTFLSDIENYKVKYEDLDSYGKEFLTNNYQDEVNKLDTKYYEFIENKKHETIDKISQGSEEIEVFGVNNSSDIASTDSVVLKVVKITDEDKAKEIQDKVVSNITPVYDKLVNGKLMIPYDISLVKKSNMNEEVELKAGRKILVRLTLPIEYYNRIVDVYHITKTGDFDGKIETKMQNINGVTYVYFYADSFSPFAVFGDVPTIIVSTNGDGKLSKVSPTIKGFSDQSDESFEISLDSNIKAKVTASYFDEDDNKKVTLMTKDISSSQTVTIPKDILKIPYDKDANIELNVTYEKDESKNEEEKKELKVTTGTIITVQTLDHASYINGYKDKTFKPNGKMTRGEASAMFARLSKTFSESKDYRDYAIKKYADFNENDNRWYTNYIGYLTANGILEGNEKGMFNPDKYMTRAEFTAAVIRFIKLDLIKTDIKIFNDYKDKWYKDEVDTLAWYGFVNGYKDGSFKGYNPVTRAEATKILNNVLYRTVKDKKSITDYYKNIMANTFTDVKEGKWYYEDILEAAISHSSREH